MNREESLYVNIDLNGLIRFLEDCKVPRETIELIVNYCKKRKAEDLKSSEKTKSYGL